MAINYPLGAAQTLTLLATGNSALTTNGNYMVTNLPTLTGNATLTLTVDATQTPIGSVLFVNVKTTATETFTFAGSIVAPVVTGVAGKTWSQGFIYNGTNFLPMGAKIQVD